MSGVEVIIGVGMVTGSFGKWQSKKIGDQSAQDEADELYESIFHQSFPKKDAKCSFIAPALPAGIDPYAKQSIEVIEAHQRQKDKKSAMPEMFFGKKEPGDVTPILGEMKDWLASVSADSIVSVEDIAKRVSYCQQILIRQLLFGAAFKSTIAQVLKQLGLLLKDRVANQRTCERKLDRMSALGREYIAAMLPVLKHAMSSSVPVPENTDLGQVLQTLMATNHFRQLGLESSMNLEPTIVGATTAVEVSTSRAAIVPESVQQRWEQATPPGRNTGLHLRFLERRHLDTRIALLAVARAVDNVAFFLSVLVPFQQLAGLAGDAAMCQLRPSLQHMLQELEEALSSSRQCRLDVMRAAKKELRAALAAGGAGESWHAGLAKVLGGKASADESWQKGLRFCEEARLEELHRELLMCCTEMHSSGSATRAAELQTNARIRLADIANVLGSRELEWHSGHALPEGLASEAKRLALCANGSGGSQGSLLALAGPRTAPPPP